MTRLRAAAIHDPCKNLITQNYYCIEHNDYLRPEPNERLEAEGRRGPTSSASCCTAVWPAYALAPLRAAALRRAGAGKDGVRQDRTRRSRLNHEQQDWNVARAADTRSERSRTGAAW